MGKASKIIHEILDKAKEEYWSPQMFGFRPWEIKPNFFFKGEYELIYFPNDMWLLRRRVNKRGMIKVMVKFYYHVKPTDIEFARYLLETRLNKEDEQS